MLQKHIIKFPAFLRMKMAFCGSVLLAIVLLVGLNPAITFAQGEEMKLLGEVNALLEQLRDDDIGQRDKAEAAIGELSPEALDFIDIPGDDATTDYIERLLRARKSLEKKAVALVVKPSVVNLESDVTINKAVKKIFAQTGNRILLNEDIAWTTGRIKLTEEIKDGSFWDAFNAILAAGKLEVDPYGGAAGTMMLRPIDVTPPGAQAKGPVAATATTPPSTTAGMLHVEVRRITSTLSTRNPALSFMTIELLTRWEPRVTPISIALHKATLNIVDDQGGKVPLDKTGRVSGVIQPEIPELSFPVNIPLVSRDIKQLDKITGKLQAVLPGRVETFTFKSMGDLEDGIEQTKSGATVTFHGYEKNEDLYAVTVELSFDEDANNVDSHLRWAYDNVAEMVSAGQRYEPVASETVMQQGQRMKVQYLFEQDPAACDLVYKTPAAIVKVNLDFELNDVPLP